MTVQDSVRVFESVSLGEPRHHCATPKNKKQTDLLLTKNYDGILSRNFKYSCTDCNMSVWLSYTDCGCVESATSLR